MSFYEYIIWYAIFAFAGWVFEVVLNVVREGAWENRGFLYGPACPIYGVGVVIAMLAFDNPVIDSSTIPLWGVFLVSMAGSAVLEYATSVAMEKLFHARWWDYSNMPLNLNGRICLPASLIFGVAGMLVAAFLTPAAHWVSQAVPHRIIEIAGLAILITTTIDATLSFSALTQLIQKVEAASEAFDHAMETRLESAKQGSERVSEWMDKSVELPSLSSVKEKLPDLPDLPDLPEAADFIPDFALNFANSLSSRQKRIFATIKGFSSKRATNFSHAVRKALRTASSKLPGKKE